MTEKPFLKWIGGKTQIIDKLIDNYPTEMNNYHDIFLGGGSTLLALLSNVRDKKITVNGKIYAYDLNRDLINVYKNVQSNPDELYKEIRILIKNYNSCDGEHIDRKPKTIQDALTSKESYYYWIRNCYNKLNDDEKYSVIGASMFIFMNKTCFRGVYRTGPNGFNVPFGHYANPKIIDKSTIISIHELIKNVKFKCCDFEHSLAKVKKGDFVYLDPPYVPEKTTSFVKYNVEGFDINQHLKLFKTCNEMNNNDIMFMMTNSDVELVKKSFPKKKFSKEVIECKRTIHSKNPAKKTNEIIIRNQIVNILLK
jgi:DNA adenine methylase